MDSCLNLKDIGSKWQKKWDDAKLFEPEAGKGEKFYLTAAYPYPNSPQHIGHARTYTTTDIYARYQRMLGKNVLFPMAFHVTGTPIFGMAKRLEEGDEELFSIFENIYNIPGEKAKTLTEPKELVMYFSKEIESGMKEIGYSIDWRRKFYTFDSHYNAFITWQFLKLKQAGLIEKGKHPVPWCPKEGQAVGAHDTKGDIDPKVEEVIAILFPAGEGFIPTTTYRPETLPGVTNLWINPDAKYLLAEFENKKLYLSQKAYELLKEQIQLKKIKDVNANEIISLKATHPLTKKQIPIFPALFVKENVGTGLVMSVPAHAPYDYLALRDGGKLEEIQLVQVLDVPEFMDYPAKEIVEKMEISSQNDEKAEEATKILYKKEAHEGKMIAPPYKDLTGAQAKEKITQDLEKENKAFKLYSLANAPVYSRSGYPCTVKIVDNQWFINYGNEKWKEKANLCLKNMKIIPEMLRKEFDYIIGWLDKKACTRASGFGTKFPFDKSQVIEALSDSTIYMAYYAISNITKHMGESELTEEFFDYAFLGKKPENASKINDNWKDARKEFTYWYPPDSRHSALDLVTNHLSFFIFNHVAIFDSNLWPKQIVANGFVTMDGKKMSKSMGNILPLREAVSQYGSDVIRFVVTSTAEIEADSDFNKQAAEGVASRIQFLYSLLQKHPSPSKKERDSASKWLYSRLHSKIEKAKTQYENFELRPLAQSILYDSANDLQWYLKRTSSPDLREFFEYWALLAAPFIPHAAEEFWNFLGKKKYVKNAKFASTATFPSPDKSQINPEINEWEEYIQNAREDVMQIQKLIKKEKLSKISFIVHAPYKEKVRSLVAKYKKMPEVMKNAKEDKELSEIMQKVSKIAPKYIKNIGKTIGKTLGAEKEFEILENAKQFLSSEFGGAEIVVMLEADAPKEFEKKAENAQPSKPSIIIA
ncbi:MAG: leucine--tRNA ligase [Candidatus Micrarchaeota archaeon]